MDSVFSPELINLHFYFNLESYSFEAKADVTGKLTKDTNEIQVYAKRLQFEKVFYKAGETTVNAKNFFYDEDTEMMIFIFPQTLKAGAGNLVMMYTSELNEQFRGLYYINFDRHRVDRDRRLDRMRMRLMWEKGFDMEYEAHMEKEMERMEEMYQGMIVGNFYRDECMKAFPCWYNMKITYNVFIECMQDFKVLSNMSEKKEHNEYVFEPYQTQTPMRLAIAIGNFQTQEVKGDALLRFHSSMEEKQYLDFAKERAHRLMTRLKAAWPKKIDFVEVPDLSQEYNISSGLAMFRETYLMATRDSSAKIRSQIRRAIANTMAAQYIYATEKVEHESLWTVFGHFFMDYDMEMLKLFYTDVVASAMDEDMPRDMTMSFQDDMYHKQKEETERKSKQFYDTKKWEKINARKRAAAMLAKWLAEPSTKESLDKMSANNDPAFWQATLKKFMTYDNLKERDGFPLIRATWEKEGDKVKLQLEQDYYYGMDGAEQPKPFIQPENAWPLNLKIHRKGQMEENMAFNNFTGEMTFDHFTDQDWIFISGMDFFRTEYSEEMLEYLMKGVRDQTLPPLCRMKLQNDLFALTRDSRMNLHQLIKCLLDYSHETDYYIWYDMIRNFDQMDQLLQNKTSHDIWLRFTVPFFHNIWKNVGWEKKQNEKPIMSMLRGEIVAILGRFGDHETVKEARRRFKHFRTHREYMDPNIRYGVYVTVLANENGRESFDHLMKMYTDIKWTEEKHRIEEAFGAVKRRDLLKEVARLSMSRLVYKQDCFRILRGMCHTPQGRDVAWQFFKNHWSWFDNHFRYTPMEMEIIRLMLHKFASADMLEDAQMFFKNHMPSCGYHFLQKYYWRIRWNIEWKHSTVPETMQMIESTMKPN